jgi:tetratricopeptide (TPR) repeat protein
MSISKDAADAIERGERARRDGRQDDARVAFAEVAALCRRHGQHAELAHALTRQAQIERDAGSFDRALAYQLEALAIERTLNNPRNLAHTIRHTGDILQAAGRHGEADPHYREMLELYRARSDIAPLEFANAVRSAAVHNEYLGNFEQARILWLEARERYSALDAEFLSRTGKADNPGVREADRRLAALQEQRQ